MQLQTRKRRVSDVALSMIRTYVPLGVAAVVAWVATRWGIVVPEAIAGEAVVWIVAGAAAGGVREGEMGTTTDANDRRLTHDTDPADGPPVEQAEVYLVLSDEERAKGFVRPLRTSYIHA